MRVSWIEQTVYQKLKLKLFTSYIIERTGHLEWKAFTVLVTEMGKVTLNIFHPQGKILECVCLAWELTTSTSNRGIKMVELSGNSGMHYYHINLLNFMESDHNRT